MTSCCGAPSTALMVQSGSLQRLAATSDHATQRMGVTAMLATATSPAVQLAHLEALEAREPWLAPICRRVRELTNAGFGNCLWPCGYFNTSQMPRRHLKSLPTIARSTAEAQLIRQHRSMKPQHKPAPPSKKARQSRGQFASRTPAANAREPLACQNVACARVRQRPAFWRS